MLEATKNINTTYRLKVIHYVKGLTEEVKCYCGKPTVYKDNKFRTYCSIKCSANSNSTKKKKKDTRIERYGVDNYSKTQECKDKVKATNLERYGVDYYFKTEELKEKIELY